MIKDRIQSYKSLPLVWGPKLGPAIRTYRGKAGHPWSAARSGPLVLGPSGPLVLRPSIYLHPYKPLINPLIHKYYCRSGIIWVNILIEYPSQPSFGTR